jgi:hypothetical protein
MHAFAQDLFRFLDMRIGELGKAEGGLHSGNPFRRSGDMRHRLSNGQTIDIQDDEMPWNGLSKRGSNVALDSFHSRNSWRRQHEHRYRAAGQILLESHVLVARYEPSVAFSDRVGDDHAIG